MGVLFFFSSVQKKADSLQLTLTRSFNQGRLFTVIGDIDVGTIVQQKANNIKKSHPGSRHPSCAAKPPEDIDTGEKKGYPLFSVENLWVSYSFPDRYLHAGRYSLCLKQNRSQRMAAKSWFLTNQTTGKQWLGISSEKNSSKIQYLVSAFLTPACAKKGTKQKKQAKKGHPLFLVKN